MEFKLKWTPNPNMPYPNTWLPFKAKDLHSDNLVDYRICDLPENRYEDFLKVFDDDFLQHEPIHSTLDNVIENNPEGVEAFKIISKAAHKQKLIDVCINDRSNEICGFNILFVICKGDNADDQLRQLVGLTCFKILYTKSLLPRFVFGMRLCSSMKINLYISLPMMCFKECKEWMCCMVTLMFSNTTTLIVI